MCRVLERETLEDWEVDELLLTERSKLTVAIDQYLPGIPWLKLQTRGTATGTSLGPLPAEDVLGICRVGKVQMTLEDKEVNELLPTHWRRTYSPAAYLAPLSVNSPLAESGTERRGPQNCAACVLQAACLDVWLTTCQQEGFDSCLATGSSCELRRCRACWMCRRISLCDNFCDLL